MKRMSLFIVIAAVVLAIGGWFLRREIRRAPLLPPDYDRPARPVNAWQAGIRPDRRTGYDKGGAGRDPLMEKLRQEELRQKPKEGRN